jgi:hypothetical protein
MQLKPSRGGAMSRAPGSPNHREDVFSAGTVDPSAAALYDTWQRERQGPLVGAAVLLHLGIAARLPDTILDNIPELLWRPESESYRCGRQLTDELSVQHATLASFANAWDAAATADPPIWADERARMPILRDIPPQLVLNRRFRQLSPVAQMLLVSIAGEAGERRLAVDWEVLGHRINVRAEGAHAGVVELNQSGWLLREPFYAGERAPSVVRVLGLSENCL